MDLSGYKVQPKKQEKGIYSYAHEIADEVCKWLGDYKEFGLWVKKAKELGPGQFRAKLDYVKSKGIRNPRYLMACCRTK